MYWSDYTVHDYYSGCQWRLSDVTFVVCPPHKLFLAMTTDPSSAVPASVSFPRSSLSHSWQPLLPSCAFCLSLISPTRESWGGGYLLHLSLLLPGSTRRGQYHKIREQPSMGSMVFFMMDWSIFIVLCLLPEIKLFLTRCRLSSSGSSGFFTDFFLIFTVSPRSIYIYVLTKQNTPWTSCCPLVFLLLNGCHSSFVHSSCRWKW